ncbi:MAG: hypothetical protein ACQERN_09400 [Thermodesulfobacteriota bacterium]
MSRADNELLLTVFSSVFEGFAFMFVEADVEMEEIDGPGPCLRSEIGFQSKDKQGELEVIAPTALCEELAENILGADEEEEPLPDDAGANALNEVLNVSCGYLLAEKFGTEEVFDLSIPQARPLAEKDAAARMDDQQYSVFLVDETPILARFSYRG